MGCQIRHLFEVKRRCESRVRVEFAKMLHAARDLVGFKECWLPQQLRPVNHVELTVQSFIMEVSRTKIDRQRKYRVSTMLSTHTHSTARDVRNYAYLFSPSLSSVLYTKHALSLNQALVWLTR